MLRQVRFDGSPLVSAVCDVWDKMPFQVLSVARLAGMALCQD